MKEKQKKLILKRLKHFSPREQELAITKLECNTKKNFVLLHKIEFYLVNAVVNMIKKIILIYHC